MLVSGRRGYLDQQLAVDSIAPWMNINRFLVGELKSTVFFSVFALIRL